MAEKRDIKRHRKRLTVRFGIDAPNRLAYSDEISAHGIFIKTSNIVPPGTSIKIELTLPNNDLVIFEGMVRWAKRIHPKMIHLTNKCGMGVEITKFIIGETSYQQLIAELYERM